MTPVNEKAIAVLEKHLAEAKTGGVQSVLVCTIGPMGNISIEFSVQEAHRLALLGTITMANDLAISDVKKQLQREAAGLPPQDAIQ